MKLTQNNIQDMLEQEEQEFVVPNRIARSIARDYLRHQDNLNTLQAKRAEDKDYAGVNKKKSSPGY